MLEACLHCSGTIVHLYQKLSSLWLEDLLPSNQNYTNLSTRHVLTMPRPHSLVLFCSISRHFSSLGFIPVSFSPCSLLHTIGTIILVGLGYDQGQC